MDQIESKISQTNKRIHYAFRCLAILLAALIIACAAQSQRIPTPYYITFEKR